MKLLAPCFFVLFVCNLCGTANGEQKFANEFDMLTHFAKASKMKGVIAISSLPAEMLTQLGFSLSYSDDLQSVQDQYRKLGQEIWEVVPGVISNHQKPSTLPHPESIAIIKALKAGEADGCLFQMKINGGSIDSFYDLVMRATNEKVSYKKDNPIAVFIVSVNKISADEVLDFLAGLIQIGACRIVEENEKFIIETTGEKLLTRSVQGEMQWGYINGQEFRVVAPDTKIEWR